MVRHKKNQEMHKVYSLITKQQIFKCCIQKHVHEAYNTVDISTLSLLSHVSDISLLLLLI